MNSTPAHTHRQLRLVDLENLAGAPVVTVEDATRVARLAYAGLVWSHKFYHYIVKDWLEGVVRAVGGMTVA